MTDIVIEPFDFGHLRGGHGHVMIHVNVGKMPPSRVKTYLESIKDHTPLCKHLESLGIPFSIVSMRDSVKDINVTTSFEINDEDLSSEVSQEDLEAYAAFDRARNL